MKRQYQTVFGKPNGNCFATCIACILDLEVTNVPNFMLEGSDNFDEKNSEWFDAANSWIQRRYFLRLLCFKGDAKEMTKILGDCLCIASGQAARGLMHSVVWQSGKLLHDPHPDGSGLIGDPEDYIVFADVDPSLAHRTGVAT